MSTKVFISHTLQDIQLAEKAKSQLIQRKVLPIDTEFIAPGDISSGTNVRAHLRNEIATADKVVLVATDNSESSQLVNYELGMADALGKPIIVIARTGAGKTPALNHLAHYEQIDLDSEN